MAGKLPFTHKVLIDGQDVAGITLAGATITYGAAREGEAPTPATAFLTLVSADAVPNIADRYPGFTWGDAIPSGFTTEWHDTYEGGLPRINLGTTVTVTVTTPTGFTVEWSDTYTSGFDSVRFTGLVTAIDVMPATVTITAVTIAEALTRIAIHPHGWPEESETARVNRIANITGAPINVIGTSTATVAATRTEETATNAWAALSALAATCDAILYTDRHGAITYRTRADANGTTTDLSPMATLLDGLQLVTELGAVRNSVTVEYGPPDNRQTVMIEDTASMTAYGVRDYAVSTILANATDATTKANRVLDHYKNPAWHMPAVKANLRLAERDGTFPANIQALLELDLDDSVRLPSLLPASPVPSYTSRVLGYTEILDPYAWSLVFALNPVGWTKP